MSPQTASTQEEAHKESAGDIENQTSISQTVNTDGEKGILDIQSVEKGSQDAAQLKEKKEIVQERVDDRAKIIQDPESLRDQEIWQPSNQISAKDITRDYRTLDQERSSHSMIHKRTNRQQDFQSTTMHSVKILGHAPISFVCQISVIVDVQTSEETSMVADSNKIYCCRAISGIRLEYPFFGDPNKVYCCRAACYQSELQYTNVKLPKLNKLSYAILSAELWSPLPSLPEPLNETAAAGDNKDTAPPATALQGCYNCKKEITFGRY